MSMSDIAWIPLSVIGRLRQQSGWVVAAREWRALANVSRAAMVWGSWVSALMVIVMLMVGSKGFGAGARTSVLDFAQDVNGGLVTALRPIITVISRGFPDRRSRKPHGDDGWRVGR